MASEHLSFNPLSNDGGPAALILLDPDLGASVVVVDCGYAMLRSKHITAV
jgi:hypothetical protein